MPRPRAIVINPYAVDFKLYDEWMHPLGLYFLVDLLRQNGYDTDFFNCLKPAIHTRPKKYGTGEFPSEEIEKPQIYRTIPRKFKRYGCPLHEYISFLEAQPRPDLICIGSMMTYWIPGVVETARIAATLFPDTPMVIGGSAARLMPAALRAAVPGAYLFEERLVGRDTLRLHPALPPMTVTTPLSLVRALHMLRAPLHGPILTSLGCPMRCAFCASFRLQGPFYRRPIETVMEETGVLVESHGVTDLAFYDDALLFDSAEYVSLLFGALQRFPQPLRLHVPNGLHLNAITDAVAQSMKLAGFTTLRFGYESGSPHHARIVSAKATRDMVAAKTRILNNAGFNSHDIGIYVMIGLPGQKPDHVSAELDFLCTLGVKPKPVWLSPVPGTTLFNYYLPDFPQIASDPFWHNDLYFVTRLPDWSFEAIEDIRARTRALNSNNSLN